MNLRDRAEKELGAFDFFIFEELAKDDPKEAERWLDEMWYWNYGPGVEDRDHFGK